MIRTTYRVVLLINYLLLSHLLRRTHLLLPVRARLAKLAASTGILLLDHTGLFRHSTEILRRASPFLHAKI